jgi:hypothetical protein
LLRERRQKVPAATWLGSASLGRSERNGRYDRKIGAGYA